MQHVKPTSKGDPLCPLGFHPQVRWPTRCKRCFRDYKEHGNRSREQDVQLRKDELTVSTPALTKPRNDAGSESGLGSRNWTSSSNLSTLGTISSKNEDFGKFSSAASSWTSSPNLAEEKEETTPAVTVSITLPRRRRPSTEERKELPLDDEARKTQYTFRRRTTPTMVTSSPNYESTPALPSQTQKPVDQPPTTTTPTSRSKSTTREEPESKLANNVVLQAKASPRVTEKAEIRPESGFVKKTDKLDSGNKSLSAASNKATLDEIEHLKRELEAMKVRCERAEREKSDFMLRRLASETVTTSSRTSASEVLKLQQKVNELKTNNEDLRDDKKSLNQRVRELENDLDAIKASGVQREVQTLRDKLSQAETMCDRLAEANEEMKREIRDMEEEMDEMQDKFREDRADEYTSLKKELEQQTKNCRILSFKLRKAERKAEQLDAEKMEAERKCREVAGGQVGLDKVERIKQLEHELSVANEAAARLQKELEDANSKLKSSDKDKLSSALKKKAPKLGSLVKTPSGDKMSRESLTRGDSQEDPVQLLRDLQDALEREADLREQLRFAEEEAANLRKKSSRVEDDNESLVMQLKKMATKARTRRHSPSANRLTPEPVEKDEGISDEDDPSELRMLLELNEQESSVLRRKVEDLEVEGDHLKRKVKELQEKLNSKTSISARRAAPDSTDTKSDAVTDKKIKVLEEEMGQIRMKLIEKERECERLHAEISAGGKKTKTLVKSRSLDGDQLTLDLKRQLQVIETEANVLRTKTQELESENDKLSAENRRLTMLTSSRRSSSVERVNDSKSSLVLEKQLDEANKKIKELESAKSGSNSSAIPVGEIETLKKQLKKAETDKKKVEESLKRLKEDAVETVAEFYKKRTPKKPTDLTTKLQMKRMVEDLENEISEILIVLKKSGGAKNESDTTSLKAELENIKKQLDSQIKETKELSSKKDKELEALNKMIQDLESDKLKIKKDADKNRTALEKELEKLKESKTELEVDKKQLASEIEKLKLELKQEKAKDESSKLNKKIETLTAELGQAKTESDNLKKQLDLAVQSGSENSKLIKEIDEKSKALSDVEKKLKDTEEKLKKSEKLVVSKKDKITKMEKENEELGIKFIDLEKEKNAAMSEKKSLQIKLDEAEKKLKSLQEDIDSKTIEIKKLESTGTTEGEVKKKPSAKSAQEIKELKEELAASKTTIKELNEKIEKAEQDLKTAHADMERKERKFGKEIEEWERKASELEMDLQEASGESAADRKLLERAKATHKKEMEARELELAQLRNDSDAPSNQKITELQSQIDRLELALESEKHEYDELTAKYEQLEEEHVVIKASLVKEKERVESRLIKTETDLEEAEDEMKSMRDTFNAKQDCWIKEKLKFEGDELKMHVTSLEQQISVMEDELSESKVEASRLKTELVSERSAWEVRLAELTSKLNELEEEKILSSGRTKITGLKTKMELAWHKEREEQHRLLQETSTLARDLRQTLFDVERERDRERLDSKRRVEQLRKAAEEENEEIRKKLSEMQCDLLELRDAHAKLRTTNEKLRREKDKLDRERDLLRQSLAAKKRVEQDEERQIITVAHMVEQLTVLAPDLFPSKPKPLGPQPTPPVRRKTKSRETSPMLERKDYSREGSMAKEDTKTHEVNEILRRLSEAADQLKRYQMEDRASSIRRSYSSLRSSSVESDAPPADGVQRRTGVRRKSSTLRKSLSLEQTSGQDRQQIYMDDTEGSMTSIQSLEDIEKFRALHRREPSFDSRLSGGSTQSEVIPSSGKKKKLGLFGKLTKKLTKSRSMENDGSETGSTGRLDPGSDVSLTEDKSTFRDKFSGVFRKSGSTSRGNRSDGDYSLDAIKTFRSLKYLNFAKFDQSESMERSLKPPATPRSSVERPLVGNASLVDSSSRPLARKPPATAPVQRKATNK